MGCGGSVPVLNEAPPRPPVELKKESPFKYLPDDESDLSMFPPESLRTMNDLFLDAVKAGGKKRFLAQEFPIPPATQPEALPYDQWKQWTYEGVYQLSQTVAKAYIKCGAKQHDGINIFGFNSPEWHIASYAAMISGLKAAGIYPTDTGEQVAYKCKHGGAAVAVVEDMKKLERFNEFKNELPKLKAIVVWGEPLGEEKELTREDGSTIALYTFSDFVKLGEAEANDELETMQKAVKPGHCCALIYTSGTTGNPKAVMITHDNISFVAEAVTREEKHTFQANEAVRLLSYLPLTHVAGLMVDIVFPLALTASDEMPGWAEVNYARPYDLRKSTIGDRLRCVKPTMFLGVPRVWEKVAEKVQAIGRANKGLKKKIGDWSKKKNLLCQTNQNLGGSGKKPGGYGVSSKVMGAVQKKLGLDQMRTGITAAAPIRRETLEYYGSLNMQINEVYGMSECTGATTWSRNECHLWGACGYTLSGVEVQVFQVDPEDINKKKPCPRAEDVFNASEEEQGELCYRGRHIMLGYMANPDMGEEHIQEIIAKNKAAIDDEGWLHSGDKGCQGANGMFKITGRYKELIIGAGGENISPVPIEGKVKEGAGIANVMMVGDKRKFNIACLTLTTEGATGELPGNGKLIGDALGVSDESKTVEDAIKDEKWIKHITDIITEVNKNVPNNPSKIQRFTILPFDFSVETQELTPTLKLKRGFVEKKHMAQIERVYEAAREHTYVPYEKVNWPDDATLKA